MTGLLALGIGFWLGFYWGKYKTLPPAVNEIKDDILKEEDKK